MKTYEHPPMIPADISPDEIIGFGNVKAFTDFVKNYKPGGKTREDMAEIIDRLHSQGYYPLGIDDQRRVKYGVLLKSKVQQIFEGLELEKLKMLSTEELQDIGRNTSKWWRVDENPMEVEPWQIEEEKAMGAY